MYQYHAYGLIITSELKLNGLTENNNEKHDVIIRFGITPTILKNSIVQNNNQMINEHQFLITIPDVARFYVQNGNEIIIEKLPDSNEGDIQVFLMGTVFAYVLQYREYLVLHGSAILFKDHAIIFSGNSGAGKSTTAMSFAQKGYIVLTDDLVAIKTNSNGQLELIPGWPRLKLWHDALDHFKENTDNLIKVQNKLNKFEFPIQNSVVNAIPINSFYELNIGNSNEIELHKVTNKLDKLNLFIKNTFRYYMLKGLAKSGVHLKQCTILANSIKTNIVNRPHSSFTIDQLVTKLEYDIINN